MRYVIGSAAVVTALILATPAHAETPFTAEKLQVDGGLNYGIYMGDDEGDPPNPYGLGFGVDLGYTLNFGLYVGGEFNYFLGGSKDVGGFDYSFNIMQYGVELGYDIGLSPELVIRPKAGIGMASASIEAGGESESESGLFIPIGAAVEYSMGSWYLGGDLRYGIVSITSETADPITGETVENDTNVSGLILGVHAGAAF